MFRYILVAVGAVVVARNHRVDTALNMAEIWVHDTIEVTRDTIRAKWASLWTKKIDDTETLEEEADSC